MATSTGPRRGVPSALRGVTRRFDGYGISIQRPCSSTTFAAGSAAEDLGGVVVLAKQEGPGVEVELLDRVVGGQRSRKPRLERRHADLLPRDVVAHEQRRERQVVPQRVAREVGLVEAIPVEEPPPAREELARLGAHLGDLAAAVLEPHRLPFEDAGRSAPLTGPHPHPRLGDPRVHLHAVERRLELGDERDPPGRHRALDGLGVAPVIGTTVGSDDGFLEGGEGHDRRH